MATIVILFGIGFLFLVAVGVGLYFYLNRKRDCELTEWSDCTVSCGGGFQYRYVVKPESGGGTCGELSRRCNTATCPPRAPTTGTPPPTGTPTTGETPPQIQVGNQPSAPIATPIIRLLASGKNTSYDFTTPVYIDRIEITSGQMTPEGYKDWERVEVLLNPEPDLYAPFISADNNNNVEQSDFTTFNVIPINQPGINRLELAFSTATYSQAKVSNISVYGF
jgi:hypothetical protein